ncbi:MAG: glycosyltransferase [Nitrospira sp.]
MDKSKTTGARVKVCHVAMGDLWAGAEVQLVALLTYLVRLEKLDCSVVLFNEGRLAVELRKLTLPVTVISEKHHNPLTVAYHLAKIFRTVRPDIVHTHKYKDSILATMAARCVGVPHVIRVVHGMPEPFKGLSNVNMSFYTIVDRLVVRALVDKIIAVSSDIERALVRVYGATRVVRIHNGIDLEVVQVRTARLEKRKEWHFAETVTLVGSVGRLVPVKGHTVMLEALHILHRSNRTVNLLIVGDGPLREHLESEVRRTWVGSIREVCRSPR